MKTLIDLILHIDTHLISIVHTFGDWTYLILFLMIFIETGIVIFPFLPGDSLIFAASAMAANVAYGINVWLIFIIFVIAAILGDSLNYKIGKHAGRSPNNIFAKLINAKRLQQAQNFMNRNLGKSIVFGRFMPFIRTFIPFAAGQFETKYSRFLFYNCLGGISWVTIGTVCGYFFGNIPVIKNHFSLIVLGVVLISIIPIGIVALRNRQQNEY